jgi:hypothetical protein
MVDNCNNGGYVSIWLNDLKRFAYITQRSASGRERFILLSFRRLIAIIKRRTRWLKCVIGRADSFPASAISVAKIALDSFV